MGCDIHIVVEQKVGEKWVACFIPRYHHDEAHKASFPCALTRNYQRFGKLAGVRTDGPAPRGLPDDISDTTKLLTDGWGEDGHSHSWLPLHEAIEVFQKTEWVGPAEYGADYPGYHYFNIDPDTKADYRVVFWFDS